MTQLPSPGPPGPVTAALLYVELADGTRVPAPSDSTGHLVVSTLGGGTTTDVSALAKEVTLQQLLTETTQKLDSGETVTVHVDNPTAGPPATQPVSGTFWPATQSVSMATAPTTPVTGTFWPATQPVSLATAPTTPVTGTFWQTTQPVSGPITDLQMRAAPIPVSNSVMVPANLAATITAATGIAATLTLAAVAGQFHYLNSLEITLYSTAARTGVAAPIVVITTNLPGTPAFTFATAGAIGTADRYMPTFTEPLKSSVANTSTTIVCPAVVGGIWRVNVTYYTGA